jgi:hypothetical protein
VKKVKNKTTVVVQQQQQPKIDIDETTWISATSASDLKGPMVIAVCKQDSDDVIRVLQVNSIGGIVQREDFGLQEELMDLQIPGIEHSRKIHRVTPNDVSQVFVGVPVTGMSAAVADGRVKLALKSASGKYLSLEGNNKLSCTSEAIGEAQIWEFEPVDGGVFVLRNTGKVLCYNDGDAGVFVSEETEPEIIQGSYMFVVRVQMQNSAIGKQILSKNTAGTDSSTTATLVFKNAVDSLYKSGIAITPDVIDRLQDAANAGKLHEQLIIERKGAKSDSRC